MSTRRGKVSPDKQRLTASIVGRNQRMYRSRNPAMHASPFVSVPLRDLLDANTASDGLLIKFPSVIVALRCAEDVQRGMADRNVEFSEDCCIVFRVGINLDNLVAQLKLH